MNIEVPQESRESHPPSRALSKFLIKMWLLNYKEPVNFDDVRDLPETVEIERKHQETREMIRRGVESLKTQFSPQEIKQLEKEALEEHLRGWRKLLEGRSEEEIRQKLQKEVDRWNANKITP